MNKGIYFAFATALISGLAVFLNKFSISFWQSSSVFTTAKNLVAVFFLFSIIFLFRKWRELKILSKAHWFRLVIIGFIGGSVPFLLFFKGLTLTVSVNAAFVHKTLFIWVALLAIPFLKEKISTLQFGALGVLLLGVYLFLSPGAFQVGYGEFLVFLATLFWAVENIIAKKTLASLSSLVVAWGRMFFGSIFLLVFLALTGNFVNLFTFQVGALGWLILSGLILFGYVMTWYSALKLAPATVVSSILVLAVPITALLNSVFITHEFRASLVVPILLMVFGILLITNLYERFTIFRKVRSAT